MKTIHLFILTAFFLLGYSAGAQQINNWQEINEQVWNNFTKAFEDLDVELFDSLHSDQLVRVGGDNKRIKDKNKYIEGYKQRWENKSIKQTISFRFLERINNNKTASERGIYKLTINPTSNDEKIYFGKFHVILVKVNHTWKILVDYDSTEKNSINEASYYAAFALDDFDKY